MRRDHVVIDVSKAWCTIAIILGADTHQITALTLGLLLFIVIAKVRRIDKR
jgi:hypothetical protein